MGIANITNNILTDSGVTIGAAGGVATLDAGGKIPVSQLPNSVMEFKGTWSAATNNPTLADGTGNAGDVYEVSAAGTVNFGAGGIAFAVGDYVVYDGSTWQYSSGQKGTITSLTFSAPLTGGTITTSGTVGIPAATSTVDGYLSATDWTTFNGKQNALTNPVTGTGTTNYIPKFTGASTIGDSIFTENGGNTFRITAADAAVRLTGSNEYLLQTVDANGRFRIYDQTAQVERLTISSTGNVGIGTNNPDSRIHTYISSGSIQTLLKLENASATASSGTKISFTEGGAERAAIISQINTGTTPYLSFENNGAERMRITSGGNVGIGTTSPTYKLDVVGTSGTEIIARFTASGTDIDSQINLAPTGVARGIINATANGLAFAVAGSTKALITSSGNVGIGTTSPGYKLQMINAADGYAFGINGGAASSTYYAIYLGDGGMSLGTRSNHKFSIFTNDTDRLTVSTTGSVGIGTTSPYQLLTNNGHIGLTTATAGTDTTADVQRAAIGWQATGSTGVLGAFITAANQGSWGADMQFFTRGSSGGNASERMRITNGGNVLIGTTTDSGFKLNVAGSIYTSASVKAYTSLIVERDASDTIGSGSYLALVKASNTYQSIFQLNSTAGLTLWSYDGSWKSSFVTNGSTGAATFSSSVTANGGIIGNANDNYFGNYPSGDYWDIGNFGATGNVYLEGRGASTNINQQYRAKGSGSHIWSYNAGSNEIMRTTSAGNLLIGTTTDAGYKLDVNGTFRTTALWTTSGGITQWGYSGTAYGAMTWDTGYATIYGVSGNDLRFGADGSSPKMILKTSGNVGIGTTSPNDKLQVGLDETAYISIANGGSIDVKSGIRWRVGGSATNYGAIELAASSAGNSYVTFSTMGSSTVAERMRITSSGNVGIGTTSPASKLDVAGGIVTTNGAGTTYNQFANSGNDVIWENRQNGAIIIRNNSSTERMRITSGGALQLNGAATLAVLQTDSDANSIHIVASTSLADAKPRIELCGTSHASSANTTFYRAGTQVFTSSTASTEYMRLTSSGNVGIGTTSPGKKLDVSASDENVLRLQRTGVSARQWDINISPNFKIGDNTAAADRLVIDTSGNVGIGTTSPSFATGGGLVVKTGATDARIALKNTASGDASTDGFQLVLTTALEAVIENRENASLRFLTNATEAMRITAAGNLGIGTTSPSGKLHIYDNTYGDYFKIASGIISGNQTCAYLAWNNAGNITLQQVVVGAADSGGSGYRLLRIPNT